MVVSAAAVVALLPASGRAAPRPSWRVTRSDVRVVCPLTLGGSFEARTASLRGTLLLDTSRPIALTGDLLVDLRTLDSGIGLRNEHLRDVYLEVGRGEGFDTAVLSGIALGDVDAETFHGRTRFSGTLLLHGSRNTITGQAEIVRQPGSVRVEATFPLALADYGITKPQYLGVGVRDQVQVRVSLWATPVETAGVGER